VDGVKRMTDTPAGATSLTGRLADRFFQTRWMVRMPIALYQAGLGFLFGNRLLMLEHTGRKTGARRRVVLEVLARPAPGEYVIIAGFAEKAQWYRNIQANPRVRVSTGFRRNMPALAVPMTRTESAAVLDGWATLRPQRAWGPCWHGEAGSR
jgi:deazaflavin-dependent oxidoreductase (nitroreductase family)